MEILNQLAKEFSQNKNVEAIVLSGSKTSKINDEKSDFDIYIYTKEKIDLTFREKLAKKLTPIYKVGNTFFEDGDELNISSNISLDLMYRSINWAQNEIDSVWRNYNAKVGFTTCFLYNIKTSKILFDKNNNFKTLKDELFQQYPQKLIKNIVAKNYPLLRNNSASFLDQINLAISRNDIISIMHRCVALLNSYFDIIFAINKQLHPGEKKLIKYCEILCNTLPQDFKFNLEQIYKSNNKRELIYYINKMLDELDKIL